KKRVIQYNQQPDNATEQHTGDSHHPEMHAEATSFEKTADGHGKHCAENDYNPDRRRQASRDVMQPHATKLHQMIERPQRLRMDNAGGRCCGLEGCQVVLELPEDVRAFGRNDFLSLQWPRLVDHVPGILTNICLQTRT